MSLREMSSVTAIPQPVGEFLCALFPVMTGEIHMYIVSLTHCTVVIYFFFFAMNPRALTDRWTMTLVLEHLPEVPKKTPPISG